MKTRRCLGRRGDNRGKILSLPGCEWKLRACQPHSSKTELGSFSGVYTEQTWQMASFKSTFPFNPSVGRLDTPVWQAGSPPTDPGETLGRV
ncbi:hypothetical protein Pcinc_018830 [Petrolisthes cinctipes]|uniref:Uncharacterized protein n=1 Tax=Petrolisthes cinctipes TaxID=88211 RepID=A0AAE1KMB5_PETCI|nr:hypothetical protein Pcinc_018830 [Petrolisthes cinctipes]